MIGAIITFVLTGLFILFCMAILFFAIWFVIALFIDCFRGKSSNRSAMSYFDKLMRH